MNKVSFVLALLFYWLGGGYVDVADGSSFLSFGCWRDTLRRAVPSLEGTDPRLDGNYATRKYAVQKCYEVAKDRGFEYFVVQNGGWCGSSANAASRVRMYGPSRTCKNGKGGLWANDIYMIIRAEALCEHGGYKKAGCFTRDEDLLSELLITDLDPAHHKWGEKIDWLNFQRSIHSLACRCEEKARQQNFTYFGIGFYGECWAGSNLQGVKDKLMNPISHASSTCVGGDFSRCNDKNRHECAGIENNEYIYLITEDIASTTAITTTTLQPAPKTWRDYPYTMYKNKQCDAKIWKREGCYSAYYRGQLLVYWRYDIEWSRARMPVFASSFVCACAEAAKTANVKYFATHFWGECWALELWQVTEATKGDCTLADGLYQTRCYGNKNHNFECLGAKNYYMYSLA